jgi:hypothetical protein
MQVVRTLLRGAMALAITAGAVAPAGATTLVRASLDKLVAGNEIVVVGEVLDAQSYWNREGTFILTDVRVAAADVLKGRLARREFTVTLMGGQVGELTTLIVGGAELVPGQAYVLFLNREDLPGSKSTLTVRDLSQGAYDLVMSPQGLRAVSQASRQPLVADEKGMSAAPGGAEGLAYPSLVQTVRELANRPVAANREVK